ncbi:MAG TPA: SufE family protein [Cyclobacteriaceae bacterium]|nr:SufE family protein [Cyclobacteriaceae bacterium]
MSIDEIQDEIISEFAVLDGDRDMSNEYIIDLGKRLSPILESDRNEGNEVKGCQSKVWLVAHSEDDKVFFEADSNSMITKGLVSLLVRIFSGQAISDILNSNLYFIEKIGMDRFIGTQRSNGFAAMIKQMKIYALAFKTKAEVKS